MTPETRYTQSGGVSIAYQVFGEGSHDVVCVPGWFTNVELTWDPPWDPEMMSEAAKLELGMY